MRRALATLAAMVLAGGASPGSAEPAWNAPGMSNPVLPGYFADPSIIHDNGRWYIYATIDPWGGDHVGLWQSDNGRDWTFSQPAWPTKAAATSPASGDAMVWAPSVVKAHGRYWMYVSVGSEVWVGSAPWPGGPWTAANGGKPLIPHDFRPGYHMIDAEAFVDDDGTAYLAWGSGLNWVNGRCFMVRLAPDMVHFDGPVKDVTPAHYFEAPFLFKANGTYFLTYSAGKTTSDTYQVRYATGPTPMGPFTEAANSPILSTDAARDIISPGHHAIFRSGGRAYILYHRQALPWTGERRETLRQVAVDELAVGRDGTLGTVRPSHGGAAVAGWAAARKAGLPWMALGDGDGARAAHDDNFATLWRPGADGRLVADLGRLRKVTQSVLFPEFANRPFRFALEASRDGRHWRSLAADQARQGAPLIVRHGGEARYLRLTLPGGSAAGLWEWRIE